MSAVVNSKIKRIDMRKMVVVGVVWAVLAFASVVAIMTYAVG